jgi:hypothetical protein
MRSFWCRCTLLLAVLVIIGPGYLPAETITFEEPIFAPDTVIQQYCGQGVEFPDSVRIFTPSVATASGTHAATDWIIGQEFGETRAMTIVFAVGQHSVSVKVGLDRDYPYISFGVTATIYAYSSPIPGTGFVNYASVNLGNEKRPITETLSVSSSEGNIRSVAIKFEGLGVEQSAFEVIDDLTFSDTGLSCGGSDNEAPTVQIDQPATAGQSVYSPNVLLDFTAKDVGTGVSKIQVSFLDTSQNELESFYACGAPGALNCQPLNEVHFSFYSWLPKGYDTGVYPLIIRVRAWDFAGHFGEAQRGIIYNQPGPVNLWAMGLEITQATQPWVAVNTFPYYSQPPTFSYHDVAENGTAVPLVAGRTTVVRFYPDVVSPTGNGVGGVTGILRCFTDASYSKSCAGAASVKPTAIHNQNELARSLDKITVFPGMDLETRRRTPAGGSLNFILPNQWVQAGKIYLEAEVMPPPGLSECYGCDDGANQIRVSEVEFHQVPNFANQLVHLVGVNRTLDGVAVPSATQAQISNHIDNLRRLYPVDETTLPTIIQGSVALADSISIADRGGNLYNVVKGAFPGKAGKMAVYAIPDAGFPAAGLGGNGYSFGGALRPDSFPHEVGHAVGLNHAGPPPGHGADCNPLTETCAECQHNWCDTDWPWPHGMIGAFGFNVFDFQVVPISRLECELDPGLCDNGLNDDNDYWPSGKPMIDEDCPGAGTDWQNFPHDIMSYGGCLNWISPRNWTRIFNAFTGSHYPYLTSSGRAKSSYADQDTLARARSALSAAMMTTGKYLLVRGRTGDLSGTTNWVLSPFYELDLPVGSNDSIGQGAFTILLLDAGNQVLAERRFDIPLNHADDLYLGYPTAIATELSFSEIIPMPEGVVRVVLGHENQQLAEARRSECAPGLVLIWPNGSGFGGDLGSPLVRWEGWDGDGDQLHYMVQYSTGFNNSEERDWETIGIDLTGEILVVVPERLKGSESAMVRVFATDGFNTTAVVSPTFQVADKVPTVEIVSPKRPVSMEQGQRFVVMGAGYDLEDGVLGGEALTWSSNIDGALGAGHQLDLAALSPGSHEILLKGMDAMGHVAQAGLSVNVRKRTESQPIANAGNNQTVPIGTHVWLDGSGSSDLDGNPLTFHWSIVVQPPGSAATLTSPEDVTTEFSADILGKYVIELIVHNGYVGSLPDRVTVLTVANHPPHAAATGAGTYEVNTDVVLSGNVSDDEGGMISYAWLEGAQVFCSGTIKIPTGGCSVALPNCRVPGLSIGLHTIALEVDDGVSAPVKIEILVKIIDDIPPRLAPIPNKTILWPPDHKMVSITIQANASDNSGLPVTLTASVMSNEPEDGLGDGDTAPDWTKPVINQQTGTITLQLRAERSGKGKGREYSVAITATDSSGNSSSANVKLLVPHDQSKK